jgi:hypothetical protein
MAFFSPDLGLDITSFDEISIMNEFEQLPFNCIMNWKKVLADQLPKLFRVERLNQEILCPQPVTFDPVLAAFNTG